MAGEVEGTLAGEGEGRTPVVLVVDDEVPIQILVKRGLNRAGFEVHVAGNGEEGLERVRQLKPDIVVSDVMMPRLDGFAFCRAVKEDPETRDGFFIMLTAKGTVRDKIHGLEIGADDYVAKPFDTAELVARVRAGYRIVGLQATLREKNRELQGLYQDLAKKHEDLERVSTMKDEFLGMAAHDLRTPLTGIKGACELILDGYMGEVDEEVRSLVSMVHDQEESMLDLINDLLDISKIEAGRVDLVQRRASVAKMVGDHLAPHVLLARKKEITLVSEVPETLPGAWVDPARFGQIISNLVSNALKFSCKGDRVSLHARETGDGFIEVSVVDTGQGIRSEELPLLFRRFQQASSRPTAGEASTGLGLAIVKKLVELHGGRIWVESKLGDGSSFRFTVPLVAVTEG